MIVLPVAVIFAFLGAQSCHDRGIVSDIALKRAEQLLERVTLTKEDIDAAMKRFIEIGPPNAVQCTGMEYLLREGIPGA